MVLGWLFIYGLELIFPMVSSSGIDIMGSETEILSSCILPQSFSCIVLSPRYLIC